MRELILIRHAKSSWDDDRLADHDRPLNHRGLKNAPVMARRVAATGARVDRLLSSTALRARATAEAFSAELGVPVELDAQLYLADAATLLRAAARTDAATVAIVAHDPGITDLASQLSDGTIDRMPTCAVARFMWDIDSWREAITHRVAAWTRETPKSLD